MVLGPPGEQTVAELRPEEIHDFGYDVHRRAILLELEPSPGCLYTYGWPHHRLQHLMMLKTMPVACTCHRRRVPRTSRRGDIFRPRCRPRGVRERVAPKVSKHRKRRWNALSWGTSLGLFGKNFSWNDRRTPFRFLSSPNFKMTQLPRSWLNGEF